MREDNIQHGQTTHKHSNIQRKKKGVYTKNRDHTKDTVAQRIRQTLGPRDVWMYISALTVLRKSSSLCKKPRSDELQRLAAMVPLTQGYKHTCTRARGVWCFSTLTAKNKNVSVVCALNTISQLIFIWKIIIPVLLVKFNRLSKTTKSQVLTSEISHSDVIQ